MLRIRFLKVFWFLIVTLIFFGLFTVDSLHAAKDPLFKAEKFISAMQNSINKVAIKIKKAMEKSDISLVNCLKKKEKEMKRYYKASLRNQENLNSAWKAGDTKQSTKFFRLIELAYKKVMEVERTLNDCYKGEIDEDATKVSVIKPEETEGEISLEELFPEETTGEPDDMPIDPPSSPFM